MEKYPHCQFLSNFLTRRENISNFWVCHLRLENPEKNQTNLRSYPLSNNTILQILNTIINITKPKNSFIVQWVSHPPLCFRTTNFITQYFNYNTTSLNWKVNIGCMSCYNYTHTSNIYPFKALAKLSQSIILPSEESIFKWLYWSHIIVQPNFSSERTVFPILPIHVLI